MKSSKILLAAVAFVFGFAACQNVEFKRTSAGLPYKVFSSKKGDSIRVGSIVKYMVVQKIKDSILYSSYANSRSEYFEVRPASAEKVTYLNARGNVEEILRKTKAGDSIYIVQATDSLIKANPQAPFKKGEQLITTIKILQVFKNADEANAAAIKDEAANYDSNRKKNLENFKKDTAVQAAIQKDARVIEDYLTSRNIAAEKSEWGIYMERIAPGQGSKPKFGQYSNVRYKGMHLSGESFDQGQIPVQIGVSQVAYGFMEGVSQMSKGEKARIYIPSILGYGEQGFPPKIQPNEILIFEVEVLDITNQQPAQPQAPVQTPNGQ